MRFNKYGAKKSGNFPSKLEASVYNLLLVRETIGEIKDIKRQVQVYLTDAKILYKPDFSFVYIKTGETRWCEAKGFKNPVWAIKRRLWAHYGPGKLEIYEGSYRAPMLTEIIDPNKS